MTVGIFLSHDEGFKTLLGEDNWVAGDHYAVLATTTETVDRAAQIDLEDILQECADGDYARQDLTTEALTIDGSGNLTFDCAIISFGDPVTISARYLYILKGTVAAAANADEIIGSIDLRTEDDGNVSSVAAEFSYDPHATNGLFEVARSAAA